MARLRQAQSHLLFAHLSPGSAAERIGLAGSSPPTRRSFNCTLMPGRHHHDSPDMATDSCCPALALCTPHRYEPGQLMRLKTIAFACCIGLSINTFAADIHSISRLAAGPDNVLFVADWKTAQVHAITLAPAPRKPAGTAFNILDLETLLSNQLQGAKITVEDMVARP